MLIAQMVIEVLAVIASTTAAVISFRSARRARKARQETERLRSASQGFLSGLERPVVHVEGMLTQRIDDEFRKWLERYIRRRPPGGTASA